MTPDLAVMYVHIIGFSPITCMYVSYRRDRYPKFRLIDYYKGNIEVSPAVRLTGSNRSDNGFSLSRRKYQPSKRKVVNLPALQLANKGWTINYSTEQLVASGEQGRGDVPRF